VYTVYDKYSRLPLTTAGLLFGIVASLTLIWTACRVLAG